MTFTLELIGEFFSDLRGCWKQNFWRKRQPFQWKKELTIFNSYHCLWRTSRNKLQGSTSFSYQCCINYRRLFWGTVRLMKTQIFEKKKQTFQWKNFWPIFIVLSSMTKPMEQFIRVHEVSGNYCGSKKINSLERKRLLKTQNFEKKGQHFQWKKLFDRFFRVTEQEQNYETIR